MRRTVALILRAASVLMAVLLGLLLGISGHAPTAAVAVDAPPPSLAYTHGHHMSVALTYATTERGPPTYNYTGGTALDAVDRWARGASARSAEPRPGDAISYDHPAPLAQSARTAGTTTEHARRGGGDLRAVQRLNVATNTAEKVAINGETTATAYGRLMHKTFDYGPGFSREFTLRAGGRVDAINFETREVLE